MGAQNLRVPAASMASTGPSQSRRPRSRRSRFRWALLASFLGCDTPSSVSGSIIPVRPPGASASDSAAALATLAEIAEAFSLGAIPDDYCTLAHYSEGDSVPIQRRLAICARWNTDTIWVWMGQGPHWSARADSAGQALVDALKGRFGSRAEMRQTLTRVRIEGP